MGKKPPVSTALEILLSVDSQIGDRQKVVLLGAGGHAKVVLDALRAQGIRVDGVVDPELAKTESVWRALPVLGSDADLLKLDPTDFLVANGVGSLPGNYLRQKLFKKFKSAGFNFLSVVHPSTFIGSGVVLGEGVQIMAGSIIQPDCQVGNNSIVNTGATLDHDCMIGEDVHIAPGVTVSGNVLIEDGVHIGTGASIIQGVTIGRETVIGAGTVVVKSVPEYSKLIGIKPRLKIAGNESDL